MIVASASTAAARPTPICFMQCMDCMNCMDCVPTPGPEGVASWYRALGGDRHSPGGRPHLSSGMTPSPQLRVEGVAYRVAEHDEGEDGEGEGAGRPEEHVRGVADVG